VISHSSHILTFVLLQVLILSACSSGVGMDDRLGGSVHYNCCNETEEQETVAGPGIRIATCNLLKPEGRRTEMSMDNATVRECLAKSIQGTSADLIAFNELDETFISGGKYDLEAMCTGLAGWKWSLEWPNDIHSLLPPTYSYSNGFAYNPDVLTLEDSAYVWLQRDGVGWFTAWTEAYNNAGSPERTCIWARFLHKESGKKINFFITHLPTEAQGGGVNMAAGVSTFALSRAGNLPSVLAGDMNSGPAGTNAAAYAQLLKIWTDGNGTSDIGTLSGSSTSYYYAVETFIKEHPDRRIDHILTRGCTAKNYTESIETYSVDGKYWCPSDHLPVAATIEFN